MTLVISDHLGEAKVAFHFLNGKVSEIDTYDSKFTVVKDTFVDVVKKRLLRAFLGHDFKECNKKLMVMKNRRVVGEVVEDYLAQKVSFKCGKDYAWESLRTCTSSGTVQQHSDEIDKNSYSDILYSMLCAEMTDTNKDLIVDDVVMTYRSSFEVAHRSM